MKFRWVDGYGLGILYTLRSEIVSLALLKLEQTWRQKREKLSAIVCWRSQGTAVTGYHLVGICDLSSRVICFNVGQLTGNDSICILRAPASSYQFSANNQERSKPAEIHKFPLSRDFKHIYSRVFFLKKNQALK